MKLLHWNRVEKTRLAIHHKTSYPTAPQDFLRLISAHPSLILWFAPVGAGSSLSQLQSPRWTVCLEMLPNTAEAAQYRSVSSDNRILWGAELIYWLKTAEKSVWLMWICCDDLETISFLLLLSSFSVISKIVGSFPNAPPPPKTAFSSSLLLGASSRTVFTQGKIIHLFAPCRLRVLWIFKALMFGCLIPKQAAMTGLPEILFIRLSPKRVWFMTKVSLWSLSERCFR